MAALQAVEVSAPGQRLKTRRRRVLLGPWQEQSESDSGREVPSSMQSRDGDVCFYEPVAGTVGVGFWRGGIVFAAEPRWRRVRL